VSLSGIALENVIFFSFKVLSENVYILAAGGMNWQLMMAAAEE